MQPKGVKLIRLPEEPEAASALMHRNLLELKVKPESSFTRTLNKKMIFQVCRIFDDIGQTTKSVLKAPDTVYRTPGAQTVLKVQ